MQWQHLFSLIFWLALRWEQDMDKPRGDRWLLLISFIIGLSFGVHFMGLLTILALGMIYYFKNTQKSILNFLIANVLSVAILLFIFKLLLPTTLAFGNLRYFSSIRLVYHLILEPLYLDFVFCYSFYSLRFTEKEMGESQYNYIVHSICISRFFIMVNDSN